MNFRFVYDIFRFISKDGFVNSELIGTFETDLKQHDAFNLLDQFLSTEEYGIFIRRSI